MCSSCATWRWWRMLSGPGGCSGWFSQTSAWRGGGPAPARLPPGCLGRISSFSETDDGRFLITLSGLVRFTIIEELEQVRGYRRVRAVLAGYAADLLEPGEKPLPFERDDLLKALRRYFANAGVDANWEAIAAMPDPALIVSLCMACPFAPEEKQALLEAKDEVDRARAFLALLEINAFDDGHDDEDDEPKAS